MFGDPYDQICTIIGLIIVGLIALDFLLYLIRLFRRQCPPNLLKKYGEGSWAVITGASDGIGRGFADQLAIRGFNLVLISRTKSKLEKAAQEINGLNKNISIKTIVADFTRSSQPGFFDEIYDQIKELNVSLLVNNVGHGQLSAFHQETETNLNNIINMNVYPCVLLTRKLINHFRTRPKKSGIVNVSSSGALCPMPFIQTYVSTKAFMDHFSRSLQIEYPDIDVLSVLPAFVSTPMSHHKEVGMDTITQNECAEGALRELGRYERSSSHIKHDILVWTMKITPAWIMNYVSKNFALPKEMERIKKLEEEAKNKKS